MESASRSVVSALYSRDLTFGIAHTPNHCFYGRQSAVRVNAIYEDDSFSFDFQNFINRLILFPFFFSVFSGVSG